MVEALEHEQGDVACNDDSNVEHRQRHEHEKVVVVAPLFSHTVSKWSVRDGG